LNSGLNILEGLKMFLKTLNTFMSMQQTLFSKSFNRFYCFPLVHSIEITKDVRPSANDRKIKNFTLIWLQCRKEGDARQMRLRLLSTSLPAFIRGFFLTFLGCNAVETKSLHFVIHHLSLSQSPATQTSSNYTNCKKFKLQNNFSTGSNRLKLGVLMRN
jgi:hypothetical protein